jgi:hypothetical protein
MQLTCQGSDGARSGVSHDQVRALSAPYLLAGAHLSGCSAFRHVEDREIKKAPRVAALVHRQLLW